MPAGHARIAVVAGELSGDKLGAGMIAALRQRWPDALIEGVGGPAMAAAGCEILFDCEELAVMGLFEVLRHLPRLMTRRRELIDRWQRQPPDIFVGIDAPDFNLGLAKRLRLSGTTTVQYVCPSVWAWREGRVKTLRAALDHVLCLLPFEPAFLQRHQIAATFVGHPLVHEIPVDVDPSAARASLDLSDKPLLVLLPGSRGGEIDRHAEAFIAAARLLKANMPALDVVAALANEAGARQFAPFVTGTDPIRIVAGKTRTALAAATAVLVASGTATLETALHGRPLVAAYRLSPLTYRVVTALNLVKTPYVSLPNLLLDGPVVPELIQAAVKPASLAAALAPLLEDPVARDAQIHEFARLREALSEDANTRSADVISTLLGECLSQR
ncbi:MAG: lipid-A-disaccharide synthase [Pseudomonadota bacterium]